MTLEGKVETGQQEVEWQLLDVSAMACTQRDISSDSLFVLFLDILDGYSSLDGPHGVSRGRWCCVLSLEAGHYSGLPLQRRVDRLKRCEAASDEWHCRGQLLRQSSHVLQRSSCKGYTAIPSITHHDSVAWILTQVEDLDLSLCATHYQVGPGKVHCVTPLSQLSSCNRL